MGLGVEARMAVRSALCERIERIALELPHMSAGRLAFAVDDIRRIARDNNMRALADLARSLESAIAVTSGATIVLPFLEAMSDAAGCDDADPAIGQSLLASVGLRLHG